MLEVRGITVAFDGNRALDGATLYVREGEVVAVLGASGSGKTTLLRVIAGLQAPDTGSVFLDGRDLAGVPPHRRGIGLVFQDHALFPHRDVFGNVAFGLRMRGETRDTVTERTTELLELVGLTGFDSRSVGTLSGGEQQRVALARALAPEPRVLLLDEPLGSLDRRLRDRLLDDLATLFAELHVTAVYVTHDQAEAFALGHRVAVMRDGRVVQVASPDELWASPVDEDVARFLGQSVHRGRPIRPESVSVHVVHSGERADATVESVARAGPTVRIALRLDDGGTLEAAMTALHHPQPGDRVVVTIAPEGGSVLRDGTP